jgi:hypothetical protein
VIYNANRAAEPLIDAMKRGNPVLQTASAWALATLNNPKAQQAIVELALGAGDEKVRIAAFEAASESVRRFGNKATDTQATALVELVTGEKASQALLEVAAQLLGAMNLPSEKIPALIESTDKID